MNDESPLTVYNSMNDILHIMSFIRLLQTFDIKNATKFLQYTKLQVYYIAGSIGKIIRKCGLRFWCK